jgi:hypothetical protein
VLASELQADLRLSHRDILRSDVRYSKDDEDEDDETQGFLVKTVFGILDQVCVKACSRILC